MTPSGTRVSSQDIENALRAALAVDSLEVIDDSHRHAGSWSWAA